jgi:xanthine dehydrogenase YagR molybdenum-binding subunit
MATKWIGTPVDRVDGRRKVTGQARYTADVMLPGLAYAVSVGSAVASGRVVRLDARRAEAAPGVLLVLTAANRGPLGKLPTGDDGPGLTAEPRPPLQDDRVHYVGQIVALVVAGSLEQAAHAASLVEVEYERAPFAVAMEDATAARRPERLVDEALHTRKVEQRRGDCAGALAAAEVRLDLRYATPNQHPCALEPHATVARWSDGALTVYDTTQWVLGDHAVIAAAFALPPERLRVLAPFVGGMFGSKVCTAAHTLLAALAARRLGRPVKSVLRRPQVFASVGHRTETVQRIELGARRDGQLTALRHHTLSHLAVDSGLPDDAEFIEPTSVVSRSLYACPSYEGTQDVVGLHVIKPGWMRAPGEAPGTFAIECAMDELAVSLALDPIELRRRNHAAVDPHTERPFSSKHLLECYDLGAERFGWAARDPTPGAMRDGRARIGWGMATATYPGYVMGATVRVRLDCEDTGMRAEVATAGIDVGTGMYTTLAIVAADALELPIERVTVALGDSRLPRCPEAGGSNLTASTAPAVAKACEELRRRLSSFRVQPDERVDLAELLDRSGRGSLEATVATDPDADEARHAVQSFGAQFVEVRVEPEIGRIRVARVVSVFDVGRAINAKALRSQLIGGVVFGIGQALLEELVYDRAHGQPINGDLAGYLVPVNADVPRIDVSVLDLPDLEFNALGCRGAGEIGITGVAAAIANAVFHATGVRVRELPITVERIAPR